MTLFMTVIKCKTTQTNPAPSVFTGPIIFLETGARIIKKRKQRKKFKEVRLKDGFTELFLLDLCKRENGAYHP